VIVYDPNKTDLMTIDRGEAEDKGLSVISNPYLQYVNRPMADPEVQELGQEPTFRCPKCHKKAMRFEFAGFWD